MCLRVICHTFNIQYARVLCLFVAKESRTNWNGGNGKIMWFVGYILGHPSTNIMNVTHDTALNRSKHVMNMCFFSESPIDGLCGRKKNALFFCWVRAQSQFKKNGTLNPPSPGLISSIIMKPFSLIIYKYISFILLLGHLFCLSVRMYGNQKQIHKHVWKKKQVNVFVHRSELILFETCIHLSTKLL